MRSLTVGLFTQVSDSGPHGPLVTIGIAFLYFYMLLVSEYRVLDKVKS